MKVVDPPNGSIRKADLDNRFAYHKANTDELVEAHGAVRKKYKALARWVNKNVPDGREKALAITNIEQAMFWSNAAVARQNTDNIDE